MRIVEVDPQTFTEPVAPGFTPAEEVHRIAAAADANDRATSLNEQACLQLKYRGLREARLWTACEDDAAVGFALLHGGTLDLVVHPDARGRGVGSELARQSLAGRTEPIEAWSHADHPAASRIAASLGLERTRDLVVMSRPTSLPVPEPDLPAGVTLRAFTADDTEALLGVNGAAFSHHPEQGAMDAEDFLERTSEPWFDPAGLLLAVDADGELLGFHWTKVHTDQEPPYGEVYVVAVNPRAAGRGLGTALTRAGLRHLAGTGVGEVILYVDGDNAPARAVYSREGFTETRVEAQYAGTPTVSSPSDRA